MIKEKKHTVLVVEDEKPLLNAIKSKLELSDFDVVAARSAKEASAYIENEKADIIWLDHYLLGRESGLDFVAKIKNDKKFKHIPVFVVSNTATADKVKSYISLGVNKYYTKADYRLDKIIEEMKDFLSGKGTNKFC